MKTVAPKRLNKRALTALTALASGVGLPVSGLAVHMLHDNVVAGALHFWIVSHEVLGVIFTISTVCHVVLNRKVLAGHLWGPAGGVVPVSREALWAVLAVGAMFLVVVSHTLFDH